jgi:hypothetical protein
MKTSFPDIAVTARVIITPIEIAAKVILYLFLYNERPIKNMAIRAGINVKIMKLTL